MPPLHNVRLTPLEVLDQLVDVVDALSCRATCRQPELCCIAVHLQVSSEGRLNDLSTTCGLWDLCVFSLDIARLSGRSCLLFLTYYHFCNAERNRDRIRKKVLHSAFHQVLFFQSFCDCDVEDDMLVCLRSIMCG